MLTSGSLFATLYGGMSQPRLADAALVWGWWCPSESGLPHNTLLRTKFSARTLDLGTSVIRRCELRVQVVDQLAEHAGRAGRRR